MIGSRDVYVQQYKRSDTNVLDEEDMNTYKDNAKQLPAIFPLIFLGDIRSGPEGE
jgi:hypothetical protein